MNVEAKYPKTWIRTPDTCLACGAVYSGGSALVDARMKVGLRVFYRCGASLSVREDLGDGAYLLLFKNCSERLLREEQAKQ